MPKPKRSDYTNVIDWMLAVISWESNPATWSVPDASEIAEPDLERDRR